MPETPLIITGMQSLRLFFSYSTENKHIVGDLKQHLELRGFEVFLAHEDIEPCIEWQDDIIKNLLRSDIFIPLFTDEFKNSDWTDQEIGIAIASDKFVIPLQTTIAPYGFIGRIQSLKINEAYLEGTANEIIKLIKNKSKFGEDMKSFAINALTLSGSFAQAKARAKLLDDFETFTASEVNRILVATKENGQIHESYGARDVLIRFFEKYKNNVNSENFDYVMNLLSPA